MIVVVEVVLDWCIEFVSFVVVVYFLVWIELGGIFEWNVSYGFGGGVFVIGVFFDLMCFVIDCF